MPRKSQKGRAVSQMNRLTDYQKSIIRYLLETGKSVEEIRKESRLKRLDGAPIRKDTVERWKKRLASAGQMETKKRPGRPRLLGEKAEERLIKYIKKHNTMVYSEVKSKIKDGKDGKEGVFEGSTRTVNRYAARNGISKSTIQSFAVHHLIVSILI